MENKRKLIFITLLLILAIIVIGIMGYMMYNMNTENNNLEEQIEKLVTKDEEIVIKENSFELYQENYRKSFKQMITDGNIKSIWPDDFAIPGVVNIDLDENNDVYLNFKENSDLYAKYGKKYKVETEVANIFLCDIGTAGYTNAIFLKLDGTASYVNGFELEQTGIIKCEEIEGVKNAVNIITYTYQEYTEFGEVGAGGPVTAFIDINGNIIKEM